MLLLPHLELEGLADAGGHRVVHDRERWRCVVVGDNHLQSLSYRLCWKASEVHIGRFGFKLKVKIQSKLGSCHVLADVRAESRPATAPWRVNGTQQLATALRAVERGPATRRAVIHHLLAAGRQLVEQLLQRQAGVAEQLLQLLVQHLQPELGVGVWLKLAQQAVGGAEDVGCQLW